MKKFNLNASPRTVIGRKVKQLRKQNQIPGNIFGKKVKSLPISLDRDAFSKVFADAGETSLIDLKVGSDLHPVLVKNVQVHPVTNTPLHIDLYEVDMKEKVNANVPVKVEGSAPAVDQKLGVLLEILHELEVEALPADLPEFIAVDVSKLETVGTSVKVADLKVPTGVEIKTDKDLEVVKIGELVSKEAEAQAQAEESAAAAAAAAATTTTEGAAASSAGATPTETKTESATEKKTPPKA